MFNNTNNPKKTLFLILILFIISTPLSIATIRYVSTTGSSTPPYTTWETAADSIQKCINFSVDGDTIIVANGVYKELLVINNDLFLFGMSMDSTIIDSRGLIGTGTDSSATILVHAKLEMSNIFTIGDGWVILYGWNDSNGMIIKQCRFENGSAAVAFGDGINKAEDLIIKGAKVGVFAGVFNNSSTYYTRNNLIVTEERWGYGISHAGSGTHIITDNIIIHTDPEERTESGIRMTLIGKATITNNIVAGYEWHHLYIDTPSEDSVIITNNLFGYSNYDYPPRPVVRFGDGDKKVFKNNIIMHSIGGTGLGVHTNSLTPDYNLYWGLQYRYYGYVNPGENEITADPMLVKDTIPDNELNFDYHLQAYSPAIDAGDPSIFDVDGTRSDIGPYGGPLGERYTYQDLAPHTPVNLSAEVDSLEITLTWNRNTEADFSYYRIYRDTVPGFTIDTTKLISSQSDTFYIQLIPMGITRLVYKLTAVDSQGNVSGPSEDLIVHITSVESFPLTISDYRLYQNYPNPFNPSTKIGYRLKERGYVKLMVYDIKGELVEVLINEVKEAGYYEEEFKAGVSSGLYIYRIEIIGEGNIPRFSDMRKMMLVK